MKVKLFMTAVLLVIGAGVGIVGKGVVEKKNVGEETTISDEISNCIALGGGIVKGLTDDAFHVIKETDFADGREVKNPISGKTWIILSQEKLTMMLAEAKGEKGEAPANETVPVNQPTPEKP